MPSQRYFNRLFSFYAPVYSIVSKLFNGSRKRQIQQAFNYIKTENSTPSVLLIGAGDGVDIPFFSKHTRLVYLDAAHKMVKHAKRKFGKLGHIQFVEKDVDLFQTEEQFDLVCMHFCLSVTANPDKMVRKAFEMVKTNGIISILDVSDYRKNGTRTWINQITKRSMFDLYLNISKMIRKLELNLSLLERNPLYETALFSSYIYQKDETQ